MKRGHAPHRATKASTKASTKTENQKLEFGRSGAAVYAALREPALKSARPWAELRLEWSRLNCTTKCPEGGDASACGPELALSPRLIQGVQYYHTRTGGGGDLFLTEFGLPFATQLHPQNWLAEPWFDAHRRRLRGTSAIYRTQSKLVNGRTLDLVVRFNRMGEYVPSDAATRALYPHAAFNSPFEEIAVLLRLRATKLGRARNRIATKRPLAIYSPPTRLQPWQTGRSETEVAIKQARLPEFELDALRAYILVYGWIKGMDLQDAVDQFRIGAAGGREEFLAGAVREVESELQEAGFRMLDIKPAHIVVRFTKAGQLLRRKNGRLAYALIDYELLEPMD